MAADERPDNEPLEVEGPREDADEGPAGPITLDRYLSNRRPVVRMGWAHLASLLAMLVGLLLIVFYRHSCARAISQTIGIVAPGPAKKAEPGTP